MAYNIKQKQEAMQLMQEGWSADDLAPRLGISRGTLFKWKKGLKKTDKSIENIKTQIETLSTGTASTIKAKKISMLTNALIKLEKNEVKKIKAKKAKIEPVISSVETKRLKEIMLSDDYGLYEYQKNFIKDDSRFRIWLKSRQIGATYGCAGEALVESLSGLDQLVLSASETQALKWYGEISAHAKKLGLVLKGSREEIEVVGGGKIYIFANNFRTIQGFSGSVWLDEFAWYINPKRIWEAFIPSITSVKNGDVKARVTILSTPFEEGGLFHKLWFDEEKYYMFSRHKTSIYDAVNDGLDVDLQVLKDLFDVDSWAMMFECVFVNDDSSFFPISLIQSCVKDYTPSMQENLISFAGYDIGRTKHLSVLSVLQKHKNIYRLCLCEIYKNASFNEQEMALKDFLNMHLRAVLKCDKTGIGFNLVERLEDLYPSRVQGVMFSASSKGFMALNLKKMFEEKLIEIPNDPYLIADIHSIKRKAGAKRMIYYSKEDTNGHADRFWSLALAAKSLDIISLNPSDTKGGAFII